MIYLYLQLRYHRQLNRICPDVTVSFLSALADSVRKNGGVTTRLSGGNLYQFDSSSVGYAFSASRVLADLDALLNENRERIREYFTLVDFLKNTISPETFQECLSRFDTVVTPDEGILLTDSALECLSPYLTAKALPETGLSVFSGLRASAAGEAGAGEANVEEGAAAHAGGQAGAKSGLSAKSSVLSLYANRGGNIVTLMRNLVASVSETLTEVDEEVLPDGNAYALDMHALCRFTTAQPEWRVKAALDYLVSRLQSFERAAGKKFRIETVGGDLGEDLASSLSDVLGSRFDSSSRGEQTFAQADVKRLPQDLAELAYLVYRGLDFLFLEELPAFFLYLDKQLDFLVSLGSWMARLGLLSDSADFRSINESLRASLYRKVGDEAARLDAKIAGFLWDKLDRGELLADFSLYESLTSLGFQVTDSFLVSCIYHSDEPLAALGSHSSAFRDSRIPGVINDLERAIAKYRDGQYEETSRLSKDVLHSFQKERVLPGELRALELISMLSLARKKGDDAVVYLEYAIENAERMRDPLTLLAVRFDMAMVHFGNGNFHFAQCALDSAGQTAERCFAKDREVLILFMKGRVSFELGDYRNAELVFQTASSLASSHRLPEQVALCRTWYARTLSHQSRFHASDQIFRDCMDRVPEAYTFLLESSVLSGRPITGQEFPEDISVLLPAYGFWPDYYRVWASGFFFAEDLATGAADSRIAARMHRAFLALYRARFEAGSPTDAGVASLAAIAHEAFDVSDPYAALYYHFCFEIGSRMPGTIQADVAVFLSRGFKYLQKRANEIGDNSLRERFMQNPVWNNRIYRAARENMLI